MTQNILEAGQISIQKTTAVSKETSLKPTCELLPNKKINTYDIKHKLYMFHSK